MSLWKIAWRSIQQRGLASTLTALSMALGVALVVAVLVIYGVIDQSFRKSADGYELIVGAKGGKLQLVLNTVYHLSTPVENIPYSYYQEFIKVDTPQGEKRGKFADYVHSAIPFCLGDNYEGYRVVGTVPQMFNDFEYAPGQKYEFAEGGNFEHEHFFEGVIGSLAARATGLGVGDKFNPTHGITGEEGHTHDAFTVVGVLKPTGTPNDRALFVNMEGFYLLEGHASEEDVVRHDLPEGEDEHEHHDKDPHKEHAHEEGEHDKVHHGPHDHHHEPLPLEQREVTAILVRTNPMNPVASMLIHRAVNKGPVGQAVFPRTEIYKLFDGILGNLQLILLLLAGFVVVVAGVGIMVSIYNSMNDRRREIAIMRSLGAGRSTVLRVILLESILLSLGGGALGVLLGHGLIGVFSPMIVAQTGVEIGFLQFSWYELILIPGLVVLASLVGYLPAVTAYRTDVAKVLSAAP